MSLFIDNTIPLNKRDDLTVESGAMETIFIEIDKSAFQLSKNVIMGVIYRPPKTDVDDFNERLLHIIEQIKNENVLCCLDFLNILFFLSLSGHW